VNRLFWVHLGAAGAAVSAGATVVATHIAVGETDPVTLAFYRYVIAFACLAPILPFVWPKARLPLIDVFKIALLGALFFAFFPWAFSAALQYTTAARGAIGIATIPIQTLMIAAAFGLERMTGRKILSVLLAVAGIAVVFGPEAYGGKVSNYLIGDGLMLLGAFSAAIYSAFSRPVLGRHGPMFFITLAIVFGLLALLPFAIARGALTNRPHFSGEGWTAVIFIGTVGSALQFSLFTWALRWLPPSRVVIYLTLVPVTAMLLGNLMLGETLTLLLMVGLAFVISGILVANVGASSATKSA
jgi:drug/metabolite transporter (DMT)-like permease